MNLLEREFDDDKIEKAFLLAIRIFKPYILVEKDGDQAEEPRIILQKIGKHKDTDEIKFLTMTEDDRDYMVERHWISVLKFVKIFYDVFTDESILHPIAETSDQRNTDLVSNLIAYSKNNGLLYEDILTRMREKDRLI